jgi:hypothetical protein
MPSVLDATLVIQMVHFLCAYWILSKFFLKPAYAYVMKIDTERATLKNAAVQQQEELNQQRQEKVAELTVLQHELLRSAPVAPHGSTEFILSRVEGLTTSGQPAHPELVEGLAAYRDSGVGYSEESKSALAKELTELLKKRVIHE